MYPGCGHFFCFLNVSTVAIATKYSRSGLPIGLVTASDKCSFGVKDLMKIGMHCLKRRRNRSGRKLRAGHSTKARPRPMRRHDTSEISYLSKKAKQSINSVIGFPALKNAAEYRLLRSGFSTAN